MALIIEQPPVVHIFPRNEHIAKIKVVTIDSEFLADTCPLRHLIEGKQ
jgi:hypothetical protein